MALTAKQDELEYKAVYALIVAGKSAKFAQRVMERFRAEGQHLFNLIRHLSDSGKLRLKLKECRSGNYTKLCRALPLLAKLTPQQLASCSPGDLERIPGIGPKTSRFFILWTRSNARVAALDVHILRWLRQRGHDAPRTTPANRKTYARLEAVFLQEADARGVSPRDLDYAIWQEGSERGVGGSLFTQNNQGPEPD